MDIVITLPATIEWKDYEKELKQVEDETQILNFKVPNLPTKTSVGSRCYLCHKGYIIGWMKIVGLIGNHNFNCTTTGKDWSGNFIQRSGKFTKLSNPIPCKGFRGFKYF